MKYKDMKIDWNLGPNQVNGYEVWMNRLNGNCWHCRAATKYWVCVTSRFASDYACSEECAHFYKLETVGNLT